MGGIKVYSFFRDSRSSGNFGAYSGGGSARTGDENKCTNIDEFIVEDISACEYVIQTGKLPAEGSKIYINKPQGYPRIAVVDFDSGMIIGHVPVNYSYIIECINKGYNYNGEIKLSIPDPVPYISVKIK